VLGGADILILTHESLLTGFAYLFRVQDPLVQSDAMVVLMGSSVNRSAMAAELYKNALAPIVLMSQTKTVPFDETENNRRVLTQSGVPVDAVRVLAGEAVENTHDEALRVRNYLQVHRVRRITIVTTAFHTARARWTFRRVLSGLGVDVRVVATQDPRFTETDWYTKDDGIKEYLSETLKTFYYRLAY